jgi:hypothetical protein
MRTHRHTNGQIPLTFGGSAINFGRHSTRWTERRIISVMSDEWDGDVYVVVATKGKRTEYGRLPFRDTVRWQRCKAYCSLDGGLR